LAATVAPSQSTAARGLDPASGRPVSGRGVPPVSLLRATDPGSWAGAGVGRLCWGAVLA
jgi:hypothetical protein